MKKNNIVLLIGILINFLGLVASAPQPSKIDNVLFARQENYVTKSRSYSCASPKIACPKQNNGNLHNAQRPVAHDIKENSNSFILTLLEKNKELHLKPEVEVENSEKISSNDDSDEYFVGCEAVLQDDEAACKDGVIDEDLDLQFDMDA